MTMSPLNKVATAAYLAKTAWAWICIEACWLVHGCVAHPICSVLNTAAGLLGLIDAPIWASHLGAASDLIHDGTMPVGSEPRNVDRRL